MNDRDKVTDLVTFLSFFFLRVVLFLGRYLTLYVISLISWDRMLWKNMLVTLEAHF